MKNWVIGFAAVLFTAPPALAAEQVTADAGAPVAECIKQGRDKGLSGAAFDTFLRECVTARSKGGNNPAGVPKDITPSCSG